MWSRENAWRPFAATRRTYTAWHSRPTALARRISAAADDPHYVIATQYHRAAWFLATADKVEERDPAKALELAHKAVELFPKSAPYWVTLGVAQYRAGEWQAAVAAF